MDWLKEKSRGNPEVLGTVTAKVRSKTGIEGKTLRDKHGYDDKTLCQNGDETDETNERFKAQQGQVA